MIKLKTADLSNLQGKNMGKQMVELMGIEPTTS